MRPEGLNFTNFISNYVFNPFAKELSSQDQRAALVSTIALTVFTLGMGTVLVGLGHLARYAATQLSSNSRVTDVAEHALSQDKEDVPQEKIEDVPQEKIGDINSLPENLKKEWDELSQYERDLQEATKASLEVNFSTPPSPEKVITTDGRTFAIKKTEGDGSCGVHALLGEEVEGRYYLKNAQEVRKEFCNYLSELKEKDELPLAIQFVLDDYLQGKGSDEELREFVNSAKGLEGEEKEVFMNKVFFDAYLQRLAEKETYLDQQELIALAAWRGIDLRIIQKDNDGYTVTERPDPEFVKVPSDSYELYIYYNGKNHFERAIEEVASS